MRGILFFASSVPVFFAAEFFGICAVAAAYVQSNAKSVNFNFIWDRDFVEYKNLGQQKTKQNRQ